MRPLRSSRPLKCLGPLTFLGKKVCRVFENFRKLHDEWRGIIDWDWETAADIIHVFVFHVTRYDKLWPDWRVKIPAFSITNCRFQFRLTEKTLKAEKIQCWYLFLNRYPNQTFFNNISTNSAFSENFCAYSSETFKKIRNSKIRRKTWIFRRIWRIFENVGDLESGERTIQKVSRKIKTKSPVLVVSLQYL